MQASGHRFDPDRLHHRAADETRKRKLAAHAGKRGQPAASRSDGAGFARDAAVTRSTDIPRDEEYEILACKREVLGRDGLL